MNLISLRPHHFFATIATVSFALVTGGIAMAHWLNLAACPLCIIQRMLYMLLVVLALLGVWRSRRGSGWRPLALVTAAAAATGIFVAGYQVWIQRFARNTVCAAAEPWWESFVYWAGERLPLLFKSTGLCSDPAWKFLSLSIAEWSLLAFIALAVLALKALVARNPRRYGR